jgi:3-oxoacyl-[acyl-carrier-protein] synthase III
MNEAIAISGVGSYLPRNMVDNAALPPLDAPVSDEELARIGVRRRGWADESEGIAEMGEAAARRALESAGVAAGDIDVVVLSNWTERRYIPEHAPKLLHLLGARRAFGFDVSCACAGFLYGLAIARGFLRDGRFSRALVVASEHTAKRARPRSKGTLILGDAAGAFVLERGRTNAGRLVDHELATMGEHHSIMSISEEGWVRTHIEQRTLNDLAGESMLRVIRPLLERNGLDLDGVDWILPHSGTAGVQAAVARKLDVSLDRILSNFAEVGNVSSASIPLALDHYLTSGRVKRGQKVLSMAVGTGWYAAAALYTV